MGSPLLPGRLITVLPEMFFPLTSLLLLLSLLTPPGLSSPARVIRQRLPKFKNFPIVGLKSTEPAEVDSPADLEDHRRDPRETEQLEDEFVEEAVFLTPEDREQRALEVLFEDDDQADYEESYKRIERDGGHGHHHAASQRGGRHRSEPAAVEPEYEEYEEDYENYDYNFANDDGSSRQEVGAPDAIRGSYSFVTPEGEQVSVQYHADETGFHATGSHVPQAPPMP